jgi:hypothetical protein
MHSSRNPAALTNPDPNMTLSRLNLILVPSVLALASPGWAEARQANAKAAQPRPLNLSLPRDALRVPGTGQVDETVQRNLRTPAPVPDNTQAPPPLRYGTGYEHRQQELGGAATGSNAGSGSAAGSGRRGR